MSATGCPHMLVSELLTSRTGTGLRVTRCQRHSRARVTVWTSLRAPRPLRKCACTVADRFLIAMHDCTGVWRQVADVVVGCLPASTDFAVRVADAWLAELPGCVLAVVHTDDRRTVFRTRAEEVLWERGPGCAQLCEVCAYPWLVAGYRLAELSGPVDSRADVRSC